MFKSIRVGTSRSAVQVVGVFAPGKRAPSVPNGYASLGASDRRALTAACKTPGFKADAGELISADSGMALLGLGKSDELDADALRTIGARVAKGLDRMGVAAARIHLAEALPAKSVDAQHAGQCVAEGASLGNWRVDFWDGEASKRSDATGALTLSASDSSFTKGLKRGLLLGESANYARRLAATPPNICNPPFIAREARKLAKVKGLTCKVITFAQAKQMGMGGLVNVGKASDTKPCMVILEHKPARAKKNTKLALVGKTITYDTGGYSIKPSASMKGMKSDKNGGMAVLGAMHAIASLNLPVNVVAVLPTAENMVSGDAYRPDDIITMYNGVTVEVTNTDAEGRLVLADALAYACKHLKPTAIVDAATLTGGVVVGLGHFCSGLWCNDDALRERIENASETSGEKVWRLPLWKQHMDFMRAKHADLWNSAPSRNAHPIQGAAFLAFFVDEKIPWAHVDIAGVSDVESDQDLFVTGPTGYGARLFAELAETFA